MKNKIKEYKSFNLPNQLTEMEQYFYYLKEFGIFPKYISPRAIEMIFVVLSKDYLEEYIDYSLYSFLIERVYVDFVSNFTDINKKIEKIMELVYEDEYNEKEKEVKTKLEEFISQK